jgi:hypothetical protein
MGAILDPKCDRVFSIARQMHVAGTRLSQRGKPLKFGSGILRQKRVFPGAKTIASFLEYLNN